MTLKRHLKKIIPPICLEIYTRCSATYGFFGNHPTWEEAVAATSGYDNPAILKKVCDALLEVKEGRAVAERDSVLLDVPEYSWPLLAGLLLALKKDEKLSVLDFGGSLGTTYFQNKSFFEDRADVHWSIIEQKNFVACGKESFANEVLHFYETVEQCLKEQKPNVLVLSSVLQYLEHPYKMLDTLLSLDIPYVIIDRTPTLKGKECISIQKVRASICETSYPVWLLDENNIETRLLDKYEIIGAFEANDGQVSFQDYSVVYKGWLCKKI